MIFVAERYNVEDECTHSEIRLVNDISEEHVCYCLEDKDRMLEEGYAKVKGVTAIPLGVYELVIDYSPRFRRDMLHILNVPQFSGIRIHAGNSSRDTEGCPLVGMGYPLGDWIPDSRSAVAKIEALVLSANARGEKCYWKVTRQAGVIKHHCTEGVNDA